MMMAKPGDSVCRSVCQHIADGALDRCCEVSHIARAERAALVGEQTHSRLQSGEREIAAPPALERARQGEAVGVARACGPLDRRSAGIVEPDQLGCLVKRLSGGVVERRAEADIAPDTRARQKLAVSARNQEEEIRKGDIICQANRQSVRLEM